MIRTVSVLLAVGVLAAGCGSTPEDRGISGAGIGAAGGAIIGALTSVSVLHGALIGAAIGGVAGAVTDKSTIDLGEPAWKGGKSQSGSAQASNSNASAAGSPVVRRIQAALVDRGYDPGPLDGRSGPRTRAAIAAYQRDHGLFVDSTPTPELAKHLENS